MYRAKLISAEVSSSTLKKSLSPSLSLSTPPLLLFEHKNMYVVCTHVRNYVRVNQIIRISADHNETLTKCTFQLR